MHIYTSHTHAHTLLVAPKWSNINHCRTLRGNDGDMMSANRVQNTSGDVGVEGETFPMELVLNDNDATVKKTLNMNESFFFFFMNFYQDLVSSIQQLTDL